jgi:NADH-quinone oxidoreductase subunit N
MLTLLVVIAVVNTAISAYYYLRLIVVMFFRERTSDWQQPKITAPVLAALIVAVVGVLYFGIFAGNVIDRFSQSPPTAGIAAK